MRESDSVEYDMPPNFVPGVIYRTDERGVYDFYESFSGKDVLDYFSDSAEGMTAEQIFDMLSSYMTCKIDGGQYLIRTKGLDMRKTSQPENRAAIERAIGKPIYAIITDDMVSASYQVKIESRGEEYFQPITLTLEAPTGEDKILH